jgi:hypothetical protein
MASVVLADMACAVDELIEKWLHGDDPDMRILRQQVARVILSWADMHPPAIGRAPLRPGLNVLSAQNSPIMLMDERLMQRESPGVTMSVHDPACEDCGHPLAKHHDILGCTATGLGGCLCMANVA